MKKLTFYAALCMLASNLFAQSVTVGTTTYGLQSNGPTRNLITVYNDGKISTAWTGSTTLDGSYLDRGTFFNHFNGVSWGAAPTTREETVRTGFGEIVNIGTKEVLISHNGTTLEVFRNGAIGSSTFTETTGSNLIVGLWPSVYCPEGTDDIYVVCANASVSPTAINFSRSMDGGDTWAVLNSPLPFLTSAQGFGSLTGNSTQMVVVGNDVYVLYGTEYTDVVLLHSPTKGNAGTWTSTQVIDFPIDNYTGAVGQISDYNGDFIADTINTNDGYYEMIVSSDGTVHVWTGAYRLLDVDPLTSGWTYFPLVAGIYYWNSATATTSLLNFFFDTNNVDGFNDPFLGLGAATGGYLGVNLTSMSTVAYDATNDRMFLMYSMPIENTDLFGDPYNPYAQSFRDLFGVYSDDNGLTWSTPVNLTNNAIVQKENVFPSAYHKVVNGKIHLLWQEDNLPGTAFDAVNPDPITINNIKYQAFTPEDFGVPVCDIINPPTGLFASPIGMTNAKLNWNIVPLAYQYQVQYFNTATPATKLKKKSFTNSVNISGLTPGATYNYKVKTICPGGLMSPFSPSAFFTTLLREGSAEVQSLIFPNPANGVFTISASGLTDQPTTITIVNALGAVVYEQTFATDNKTLTTSIDISEQAAGLYFIQIVSGNVKDTGNLIIE